MALALYAEDKGRGRWVSYSRARTHYEAPGRYRSPLYTYRKVKGAVDQLEALGLIDHQKSLPGERGWQSAMIARPKLIQLVHEVTSGQLALAPLREPILLRDAEKNLIDYHDARWTKRIRERSKHKTRRLGLQALVRSCRSQVGCGASSTRASIREGASTRRVAAGRASPKPNDSKFPLMASRQSRSTIPHSIRRSPMRNVGLPLQSMPTTFPGLP